MRNKGFIFIFLCIILFLFLFIPVFAYSTPSSFGDYWDPVFENSKIYRRDSSSDLLVSVKNGFTFRNTGNVSGLGVVYNNVFWFDSDLSSLYFNGSQTSKTVSGSDLQYSTSESEHTYNTVQLFSLPFNLQNLDGNYFSFSLSLFGSNLTQKSFQSSDGTYYTYQCDKFSSVLSDCYVECYVIDSKGNSTKLKYGEEFLTSDVVTSTWSPNTDSVTSGSYSFLPLSFKLNGNIDIQYLFVYLYSDTSEFIVGPNVSGAPKTHGRWSLYSGIGYIYDSISIPSLPTVGDQKIIAEIEELNNRMDIIINPTNEQIEEMNQIKKDNQDSKDNLTNLGNSLDVPKPDPSDIWGIVDTDYYDSTLVNNSFKDFLSGPLISSMLAFTFLFAFFGYVLYGKKGT